MATGLGPAGFEQRGHFDSFRELPRYDFLNGLSLRFFKDAFFPEELVNARTHVLGGHLIHHKLTRNHDRQGVDAFNAE